MKKALSFVLLALFLFTCEETDEIVDFRDKYVGIYKGIEIYGHVGDTVTWVSDTTSFNIEIKVDKIYDSSFVVTIDEFSFYTDYHFGTRYACKACTRGPWHYIEFINSDSAIVHRRRSSFSSFMYYGRKE